MTMKAAVLASPEKTAYQIIDGNRVYLGYGNGSIFLAEREEFKIIRKEERPIYAHPDHWRPLTGSSI